MRLMSPALSRATLACAVLAMAACGPDSAPRPSAPAAPSTVPAATTAASGATAIQPDSARAWLVSMLSCGDREFLRSTPEQQHARLAHMPGMTCEPSVGGAPLRCAIAPPLRVGQAEVSWFVIGMPQFDLVPIVVPAPQEALRNAMSSGSGALSPGTDLGDTTIQCALTDTALKPGAIAGTVQREGGPGAAVRVCAFELAEGTATCSRSSIGERYRIENLDRGDHLVYAMPGDTPDVRIGYTDCGAEASESADAACTHELKVITVEAGGVTEDVDPADLRTVDESADWPAPPPKQ